MEIPNLIEDNVSDYLQNSLRMSHMNRVKMYSFALNFTIVFLFIMVCGGFLYYRYNNRPSPYEKQQKLYKDQKYILSKIRFYQSEQKNLMTSPIGNL